MHANACQSLAHACHATATAISHCPISTTISTVTDPFRGVIDERIWIRVHCATRVVVCETLRQGQIFLHPSTSLNAALDGIDSLWHCQPNYLTMPIYIQTDHCNARNYICSCTAAKCGSSCFKKLPKCDACRVGKGSAATCRFKGMSRYIFSNRCNLHERTACRLPDNGLWLEFCILQFQGREGSIISECFQQTINLARNCEDGESWIWSMVKCGI